MILLTVRSRFALGFQGVGRDVEDSLVRVTTSPASSQAPHPPSSLPAARFSSSPLRENRVQISTAASSAATVYRTEPSANVSAVPVARSRAPLSSIGPRAADGVPLETPWGGMLGAGAAEVISGADVSGASVSATVTPGVHALSRSVDRRAIATTAPCNRDLLTAAV